MEGWSKRVHIPVSSMSRMPPIEEVVTFLKVKSRTVTNGLWEPNFIVRSPESGDAPTITLTLKKASLNYLVQKVAELSGMAVSL